MRFRDRADAGRQLADRLVRAHPARQRPQRLILAVTVCAIATRDRLSNLADEVVCLGAPVNFHAVGQWYDQFEQTTDAEVLELLAAGRPAARSSR